MERAVSTGEGQIWLDESSQESVCNIRETVKSQRSLNPNREKITGERESLPQHVLQDTGGRTWKI